MSKLEVGGKNEPRGCPTRGVYENGRHICIHDLRDFEIVYRERLFFLMFFFGFKRRRKLPEARNRKIFLRGMDID